MRYFLYARKSSESEDRQVQSIDDQRRVLRDLADKSNLTIVEEMTEAHSAKAPGSRKVFNDMLSRIERGEADGILCWSINRLARNPVDSGRLSWLLQVGTLQSIRTFEREYLPEDNVLLMAVESGVANQYILDLRKAVIRGMEGKAARGWMPNRPPQGYRTNPETKEIEPKQPEFDLLRKAWNLLLSGSYAVPEIREALRSWGFTTDPKSPDKPIFSESHLYRIFNNPFYYGSFSFRGQTYLGKHQPMVTETEFERGKQIISGDGRPQSQKHSFPYTGFIRCGNCGCLVTAERKVKYYRGTRRTVEYDYYHCTRRKGPCGTPSLTSRYVESKIQELLNRLTIHSAVGEWLLQVLSRESDEQTQVNPDTVRRFTAKIREAEDRLSRLIELRLAHELNASEFAQLKVHAEGEVIKRKAELRNHVENAKQTSRILVSAVTFALKAPLMFTSSNPHHKRYVARKLGMRYVLTPEKLEIQPNPLLERLAILEPPKSKIDMVGAGAPHSHVPLKWAERESILNLLSGLTEEERSCVDATFFDNDEDWSDAGMAA